jgi:leucyl aminopeptidase
VLYLFSDESWARNKGMHSFLSVNAGSATPAVFLETHVEPEKDTGLAPIVLVGKGVCFDTYVIQHTHVVSVFMKYFYSGGVSIKGSSAMDEMRADMMGAACVLASAHAMSMMKGFVAFYL